jgi:multicomponent Na+:H+ antiporter subunit A
VSAVRGEPTEVNLALWHGLTVWLVLSTVALVAGIVLYVFRDRLLQRTAAFTWPAGWSGNRLYEQAVAGMNGLAQGLTRLLQSGYLRVYVTIILVTTVVLVASMITHVGLPFLERTGVGVRIWEVVAAGLILAATIVAVRSESRFQAIACLGVIGFGVAWLFHLFGAPDLAMTQVVVEALTVVLFVLAFYHLPRFSLLSSTRTRARDAALALSAGGLITALLLLVTSFPQPERISEYYAENSVPLAHGPNVVNVILVDFRALDTLGEITVLATAALGVATLLKFTWKGREPL